MVAIRREHIATTRELREEMISLKCDLQESIVNARREFAAALANVELRVTIRMETMLTVSTGILAAIIKL